MRAYFIRGADDREYGPAREEEVSRWIREHRADAGTKVRIEGEAEWERLGERPEFAAMLAESRVEQGRGGVVGLGGAGEKLAAEILARDYDLQIGDCFARGWELLMGRLPLLAGVTILVCLLGFGIGSIPGIGVGAVIVLSYVLLGGVSLVFLKVLRRQAVDVSTAFAGFGPALVPLLLAGTIGSTLVLVGGMLCLVPGIYLIVAWHMFTPLLILDKGLDFWQALECSRRVVTRHWWMCGGLFLLGIMVVAAGLLACVVGVLVALPLATAAVVVAYEDIFGTRPELGAGGVVTEGGEVMQP